MRILALLIVTLLVWMVQAPAAGLKDYHPSVMEKFASISDGITTPSVIMVTPADTAQTTAPVIGVLERTRFGNRPETTSLVRLLFRRIKGQWVPYNQCYDCYDERPETIRGFEQAYANVGRNWTVAFRGRQIGTLELGRFLTAKMLRQDGAHPFRGVIFDVEHSKIASRQIPEFDAPLDVFSGWSGDEVWRPLVVLAQTKVTNPEGWAPAQITTIPDAIAAPALAYYRKIVGDFLKTLKSDDDSQDSKDLLKLLAGAEFTTNDLRLTHAFQAADGTMLYGLNSRDFPAFNQAMAANADDDLRTPHPYVLQIPHQSPQLLGTSLELVDFGDFDGDGRTEFLFWSADYNQDGYMLCWGQPHKSSRSAWCYH
jgi:hypothetical protein